MTNSASPSPSASDPDGETGGIGIDPPPTSTEDQASVWSVHAFWLVLVILAGLSGAAIVTIRIPPDRRPG